MPRPAWGSMASDLPTEQTSRHFVPEVGSSTASSIYISWQSPAPQSPASLVEGYRVHYQKVASTYVQYSPFLPPTTTSYSVNNLVADTYYKVCVVMYRNNTVPERECVDAATTSWHIPVSIGSSIGAVLALSIIVLIVLLSRCPTLVRPPRTSHSQSSKYDSMSSHFPDDHNDLSDTITQCHDDDDVFHNHCSNDVSSSTTTESHHHHHHHHNNKPDLHACNNNHPAHHPHRQSLTSVVASGGRGGCSSACSHSSHHPHHHHRTLSLGSCGRTQSLSERSRPHVHRARRARLLQLHSAHNSIQSEPSHPCPQPHPHLTRPLHVSISDLPPAVRISTPDSPEAATLTLTQPATAADSTSVASPSGNSAAAAARAKRPLKDTPRTLHMSIDYDV